MASTKTLIDRIRQGVDEKNNAKILANTDLLERAIANDTPTLAKLMEDQRELMNVLGIAPGPVNDVLTSPLYKDVVIMLMSECIEVLNPITTSTKPWKQIDPNILREEALEETIDLLFFILELFELTGIKASEIAQRYEDKRQKNFKRASSSTVVAVMASKTEEKQYQLKVVSQLRSAVGKLVDTKTRMLAWECIFKYDESEHENTYPILFESISNIRSNETVLPSDFNLLDNALNVKDWS